MRQLALVLSILAFSSCGVGAEPEEDVTDSSQQALTSVISCSRDPLTYCHSVGYRYVIGPISKCYWVGTNLVQKVTCSNGKI